MTNESKLPILYGAIAAVLGAVLIAVAALWKNAVIDHAENTDGVVAGSAIDALLVGGLVVLGGLCIICAIVLFFLAWWRGQRHEDGEEERMVAPETSARPTNDQAVQQTPPSAESSFQPGHIQPPHPSR